MDSHRKEGGAKDGKDVRHVQAQCHHQQQKGTINIVQLKRSVQFGEISMYDVLTAVQYSRRVPFSIDLSIYYL